MPTVEPLGPRFSQPDPPGLHRLMDHLLATFPGSSNGGMYNPRSVLDSGLPSPHQVTTALDLMCDAGTAARVIRYLLAELAEELNLQQVIAWHEIWTVQRQSEGIRRYAADDHSFGNGHCHISIGLNASRVWTHGATPPPPAPVPPKPQDPTFIQSEEDDDMLLFTQLAWIAVIGAPVQGDGNLHTAWVEKSGALGHRWENKAEVHAERIHPGPFLYPQKPLMFVAPNGTLVVGALGADGVASFYVPTHGGWVQQVDDI